MLILVIVKNLKRFKQSRRELQPSKVCIFSNKSILVGKRLLNIFFILPPVQVSIYTKHCETGPTVVRPCLRCEGPS